MSLARGALRELARRLPAPLLRPLGRPVALFFHGVERKLADPDLQDSHHALEDFYAIAAALKANFDVAPLGELGTVLARPARHRRTLFLMSDDGYANTLHTAAGVLQDMELPWTLFVSTQHIDSGEPNPMVVANLFSRLARDGSYRLPHIPEPVQLNGARSAAMVQLREKFRFLPAHQANNTMHAMQTVLQAQGAPLPQSERFLNWDGLRTLSAHGVTIGAHAHWHWAMHRKEAPEFLRLQAELPKQRIAAELGTACRYFAYPFGNARDVSQLAWRTVRDAGYDYAFTTLSGTLAASKNRWLLPRYGLAHREQNLTSLLPLLRIGDSRVTRWQQGLA